jgi:hypothetical protein
MDPRLKAEDDDGEVGGMVTTERRAALACNRNARDIAGVW